MAGTVAPRGPAVGVISGIIHLSPIITYRLEFDVDSHENHANEVVAAGMMLYSEMRARRPRSVG